MIRVSRLLEFLNCPSVIDEVFPPMISVVRLAYESRPSSILSLLMCAYEISLQPEKISSPTVPVDRNVNWLSAAQSLNASSPTRVTFLPTYTDSRFQQSENAMLPIEIVENPPTGILTFMMLVQPAKAMLPIVVMWSLNSTSVREVHVWNAPSPML